MKKIKINKKNIELYDSIDELPITRFHVYNKMILIDSGVGSDLNDVNAHIEKIMQFALKKDLESVIKEVSNLRQNIYFAVNEMTPRNMAFAALVKSINGRQCEDLSIDGLRAVLKEIENAKQTELNEEFNSVKKKLDSELTLYFPNLFDNASVKEYYALLRKRTVAALEEIKKGNDPEQSEEVKQLSVDLITFVKPNIFEGKESFEIKYDKQFESSCLTISSELNVKSKEMTVLEYYNSIEFIKDKYKQAKKPK